MFEPFTAECPFIPICHGDQDRRCRFREGCFLCFFLAMGREYVYVLGPKTPVVVAAASNIYI